MPAPPRLYTNAEKRQKAALAARALTQHPDTDAFDKTMSKIERINDSAEARYQQETGLWEGHHADAKTALARARVALRVADRADRPAAKQAVRDAEKRLRIVERARPRT